MASVLRGKLKSLNVTVISSGRGIGTWHTYMYGIVMVRVAGQPAGSLLGAWTGSFAKLDTIFGMYPACAASPPCASCCSSVTSGVLQFCHTARSLHGFGCASRTHVRSSSRSIRTLHQVSYAPNSPRKLSAAEKAKKLSFLALILLRLQAPQRHVAPPTAPHSSALLTPPPFSVDYVCSWQASVAGGKGKRDVQKGTRIISLFIFIN